MNSTDNIAVSSKNTTLVDVLDRVLDKGAVVDGDIELCVAGIQLVSLKLKMLLSSTATLEKFAQPLHARAGQASPLNEIMMGCSDGGCNSSPDYSENCQKELNPMKQSVPLVNNHKNTERLEAHVLGNDEPSPCAQGLGEPIPCTPPLYTGAGCIDKKPSDKIDIDPKKVEQGLAKLVLTVVELLRQLMEKQALRRVDLGTLTDKQVDSLGEAFMNLNEKMKELKEVFGLKDEDLNLDLGPLGDLT